ncbi:class I SAM-dependent methyltransferase [Tsukamurella sp. 8F]|uniref:O-methyltransferase n=1 Tax=unclassified Tsukamurella TaxID=2633480 RepID=UPI0023B8D531|nr:MULTISPECIES: class I SAM-dependent methyltransferase [unclassified Tsukamurella]MDF0528505.1 class I SAM-dependent methyltransferase [Tsukamurella sp. 8J]MDF0586331.1 class I SAM-dependent methyltransferase [Tsukamurella sp. 8F]
MEKVAKRPLEPRAQAVVDRLHSASKQQLLKSVPGMVGSMVRSRVKDGTWDSTFTPDGKKFLSDKMVALAPAKAALAYQLCRASGARRIVEAGTSFGVSTIYLASAVAENVDGAEGEGVVIGTEHEPSKVEIARRHLDEAGVGAFADVREGDLRQTLLDVEGPIDFMLVDIWIPMALPALEIIAPKLRPGALVFCDNVVGAHAQYRDYLEYVRDPGGDFASVTIPGTGGLEVSRKR